MRKLHLALKAEYFNAIKSGEKCYEFRLYTDYWRKRIENREYDEIVLTLGYPKLGDTKRRIIRGWYGYKIVWVKHPVYGKNTTKMFAIKLFPPKER